MLALVLIEYTAAPYHLDDRQAPPFYKMIAADKNAQSVLEIPVFLNSSFAYIGSPDSDFILYNQTVHQKKLFSGFFSRVPMKTFWSYRNLPIMRTLLMIAMGNNRYAELARASDSELAPYFLNLLGVDYVIVHRTLEYKTEPDINAALEEQYLRSVLPMDRIYGDPWAVVYKTRHAPTDEITIQASTAPSVLYFYDGWINGLRDGAHKYAWATGKESVLLANLNPSTGYELGLELKPYAALANLAVETGINGEPFSSIALRQGWNSYKIRIPARLVEKGLNIIYLKPSQTAATQMHFKGMPLLPNEPPFPDYWEQNNSKFDNPDISFALSSFTVSPERH